MGKLKAHAAVFGANLIYGVNYTVAKGVMPDYLTPFVFIGVRVIGATALFWIMAGLRRDAEPIERRDYPYLALLAVFGIAANQLFFFQGLNLTTPINASIIMTLNPVLVLLISAVVQREGITPLKIIGILLAGSGAILLLTQRQSAEVALFNEHYLRGNTYVFINATSYGLYLVLVKRMMQKYRPLTVIRWVFLFGLMWVLPFSWSELDTVEWTAIPLDVWGSIAFVVIGTTFFAYLFNSYGIAVLKPEVVSTYIYFQPLLAALFALAMGADALNNTLLLSGGLVLLGVFAVSWQRP